jgi:hypothetical protein
MKRTFEESLALVVRSVCPNRCADATHQSYRELALDAVPNMVVVDHDGAVQRTWSGGLNPERSKQMSEYFGVPYGTFGAPGN